MPRRKMSVTQLTLLTSLSMMGAGIIMLPAKFAEIGAISMLSWIVTALASGAVAYVFAQCGMLSKRMGGLGGFAEYAFGEPGAFLVNYSYAISLVFGNIAISLAAVSYGLSWFHLPFSSVFACIGCVLLLWIASLLTFRSPYITGRITGIFVWALLLPLITLVIVGGFWFDPALYAANWNPHQIPTLDAVSSGISMTFWAFLGLESACANAESVENPEKNVPKAVICATLLTAFIYIATTNLTAGLVPNVALLQSDAPFVLCTAEKLSSNYKLITAFRHCRDIFRRLLTAESIAQRFAQFKNVLRDGLIRHYRTIPKMRYQFRSRNHMIGMPSKENQSVHQARRNFHLRPVATKGILGRKYQPISNFPNFAQHSCSLCRSYQLSETI